MIFDYYTIIDSADGTLNACKVFFDSLLIHGRPTGQTIGNSILFLLQKNEADTFNYRA